jgi:hypothetical protein
MELEGPRARGLDYLAMQMSQISQVISYMRKEERETAKSPLESDKLDAEETLAMLAEVLSTEDLEAILRLKKGEVLNDQGS